MADLTIPEQLELCDKGLIALGHLSDAIDIAEKNFDNLIEVLEGSSFRDYLVNINLIKDGYKQSSKYIQDYIHDYHIAYLDLQIKHLESRL